MDTIDILKQQLAALERRENHAMVTLVSADGSTPRTQAKMLVYADGRICGTVGGGPAEMMAIRDAKACIASGQNALQHYDLSLPSAATKGMICSGSLDMLIEPFCSRPLLVMCGAGHVGGCVLELAAFAGFDTILLDDRSPEQIGDKIAKAGSFVPVTDFAKDLRALDIPAGAYIVIASHGHTLDGKALDAALTKQAAYVGMIGSRKKIKAIFDQLREVGVSQEALDTVHTPIGLDLGGETPAEVAIAILAEILLQKNGRRVIRTEPAEA